MSSLSRLILIFAIVFAILIITPALLSQQFSPYPLLKTGDVTDLLTPLILIPLYWLLFRQGKAPSTRETIVFLVFAALWTEGQGMHLGANSIGHLLENAQGHRRANAHPFLRRDTEPLHVAYRAGRANGAADLAADGESAGRPR